MRSSDGEFSSVGLEGIHVTMKEGQDGRCVRGKHKGLTYEGRTLVWVCVSTVVSHLVLEGVETESLLVIRP